MTRELWVNVRVFPAPFLAEVQPMLYALTSPSTVWAKKKMLTLKELKKKKADNKIDACKISQKMFNQATSYWELKDSKANNIDPDEAAH